MCMMMMMMTLMKLVNSATKFRHGIDKFYQPNSGLRGSKSRDEAIYTQERNNQYSDLACGFIMLNLWLYQDPGRTSTKKPQSPNHYENP